MPRKTDPATPEKVLVVDVGGSHIKLMISGSGERIKFDSGPRFTPRQLISGIRKNTPSVWEYDAVTLGLPIPIIDNRPVREPNNLGRGWVKFDYTGALGKPTRIINDAAMQALGSYEGGRMLFIGLGTGLGSALILDDVLIPLELGELAYSRKHTLEGMLGNAARKRLGQTGWEDVLDQIITNLRCAFPTDYVVLGGGNARKVDRLPHGTRLGDNRNAFLGGLRLWGLSPRASTAKSSPLIAL